MIKLEFHELTFYLFLLAGSNDDNNDVVNKANLPPELPSTCCMSGMKKLKCKRNHCLRQ